MEMNFLNTFSQKTQVKRSHYCDMYRVFLDYFLEY